MRETLRSHLGGGGHDRSDAVRGLAFAMMLMMIAMPVIVSDSYDGAVSPPRTEVTFQIDLNGGSDGPSEAEFLVANDAFNIISGTMPSQVPTKNGCTFVGWSFMEDSMEYVYQSNETFSVEIPLGDIDIREPILYALWMTGEGTIENPYEGFVCIEMYSIDPVLAEDDYIYIGAGSHLYFDDSGWNAGYELCFYTDPSGVRTSWTPDAIDREVIMGESWEITQPYSGTIHMIVVDSSQTVPELIFDSDPSKGTVQYIGS